MGFEKFGVSPAGSAGWRRGRAGRDRAGAEASRRRSRGWDRRSSAAPNLAAHLAIVLDRFQSVVAVNRFPGYDEQELTAVDELLDAEALRLRSTTATSVAAPARSSSRRPSRRPADRPQPAELDPSDASISVKIEAIATRVDGRPESSSHPRLPPRPERLETLGLADLPVCVAKTHLSLDHPSSTGAPRGFTFPVPASFVRIGGPAGSLPSAARCRRCPGCRQTPLPCEWTSTVTG